MKTYTQRVGSIGAGLSVGFFALCMLWGSIIVDPVLKTLHTNILQIIYPGLSFSVVGLLIGLIEALIYGFLFGVLFAWLSKVCCVREK